ncbi:hypothetical protein [Olleya sp. 1-3]|nr:hypothetical protein [Olleya sp. 1-3]PKG50322.1 hypothetical protein CXF54_12845 [Olleya sp. 1-3]
MKYIFWTLLILPLFSSYGQNAIRIYKVESKTFEIEKKYAIQEIIIYSDSTYCHRNFRLDDKSQKDDYRYFKSIETNGTFRKDGEFYFFKPNNESFEVGRYKISDEDIIYYYDWKEEKIRKGAKYKRVKSQDLPDITIIREITEYTYHRSIDNELESSITEGIIEYGKNFDKTGGFEYYQYYYPENKDLIRIEYSASTDNYLTENYYYKNGLLIYAERVNKQSNGENEKKRVYLNNGFIIHESKTDFINAKYLIEQGNKYLNEYKASR